MNDNRLVTEESRAAWVGGQERVRVLGDEAGLGNVAVLACEITDLASRWGTNVAWVVLATVGGVEVAQGCRAVAVGWDSKFVDVVDEWSVLGLGWEASKVDADRDTRLSRGGGDDDGASNGGASGIVKVGAWENSLVGGSWEVCSSGGWTIDRHEAGVGWTIVDNGTLLGLDTGKGSGGWENREDTAHDGGESLRWWWRSSKTLTLGSNKDSAERWQEERGVHVEE